MGRQSQACLKQYLNKKPRRLISVSVFAFTNSREKKTINQTAMSSTVNEQHTRTAQEKEQRARKPKN